MSERIRTAATWLRERYARPIPVAQAAEAVGMSERSFPRHFRGETKATPSDFQRDVRLDAVCRLLTATRPPVDKIARLSRVFRQPFSLTPTDPDDLARNPSRGQHNRRRFDDATGSHGNGLIMPAAWRFLF